LQDLETSILGDLLAARRNDFAAFLWELEEFVSDEFLARSLRRRAG
jgi:hypothetical protein